MSDRHFGIIGYVAPVPIEKLNEQVRVGLASISFTKATDGTCVDVEGRIINCTCGIPTGWPPAWALFPIDYDAYNRYGAKLFVSAFRAICRATSSLLARSFHPVGVSLIAERELEGRVDYVDWIQYYGPAVGAAIGVERIRTAGFHLLEEFPDGAFLALAKAEYTGEYLNRKAVVEGLGIAPRRIMARNPKTGEPTEVSWCH